MAMKRSVTIGKRTRVSELQELLIDRFLEHQIALNDGQEFQAKRLEGEIHGLLQEKEDIASE
jgi:hypothetical protein